MLTAVFVLVFGLVIVATGVAYVRLGLRMRGFQSTTGKVVTREVVALPGLDTREARYGEGGGYGPRVRYRYTVNGVEHESDRIGHVKRGYKRAAAERAAAQIPDAPTVWFDPAQPSEAYLTRHSPAMGYVIIAGGGALALGALAALFG